MTAATTPAKPARCLCGCGEEVRRTYRQGHDSRHVAQLAAKVTAGEITPARAAKALPSDPLRAKLALILDRGAK